MLNICNAHKIDYDVISEATVAPRVESDVSLKSVEPRAKSSMLWKSVEPRA